MICDSAAVSFGAVGTLVAVSANCLGDIANEEFVSNLSLWTAVPHAIMGVFVPFIAVAVMCLFFSKKHSIKPALQVLPFAIFAGLCFSVPYTLISALFGYKFPSLLGALIGLPITVVAAKKGFLVPKEVWTFDDESEWDPSWKSVVKPESQADSNLSLVRAWIPYVIIAVALVLTRLPALGLKNLLSSNPILAIHFPRLFGVENTSYTLKWAYLPGMIFILIALITIWLHKVDWQKVKAAWSDSFKQISGATVAIIFGLALVQIMRYSGSNDINDPGTKSMIFYMAEALSKAGKSLYLLFSPIIGILGAFVSGSNTVSNTLFTNLQYQSAMNLDLNGAIIVAMQCIGGAIGNMICVNNTVAVCATVGTPGKEGKIIRINFIPMLLYLVVTVIVMAVAMAFV